MKKYRLKKDLPMLEAGNEVILELKKINDKKIGLYYDIKIPNDNRVFDSFGIIGKSKINEWLEEIPEKPKSVWDLKEGDDYYYLDLNSSYSEVADFTILGKDGLITYKDDLKVGNVFLTKEEVEKELKKRKAIQKIKKYCWENGIETEYIIGEKENSFFYHDYDDEIEFEATYKNGNPIGYFSYKDAEKILEKFEEELKIILDV